MAAVLSCSAVAGEISYTMILDEKLKQEWQVEVAPRAFMLSSRSAFTIHDKVDGKNKTIGKTPTLLGINEYNIIDFCIEQKSDPICREIIISDFSYDGLSGLLLGGRGERLRYIILASCDTGDSTCRYPHIKLGPNPVIKLQSKGIRPHLLSEEGRDAVVAGPYSPELAEKQLPIILSILPAATLR